MLRRPTPSKLIVACLAAAVLLIAADLAAACPTCKDALAHDPASANLARGVYYSILFMVTMPYLIFGSLCAYFYWMVCRAKKQQAASAAPRRDLVAPEGSGG